MIPRVTYDENADAAYIALTDETLRPGRDTVPCPVPGDDAAPSVLLDWKEGVLVGIEVLGAGRRLPTDLLDAASAPEDPPSDPPSSGA